MAIDSGTTLSFQVPVVPEFCEEEQCMEAPRSAWKLAEVEQGAGLAKSG